MRLFIACIAFTLAACSPEQSKSVGNQPKKAPDNATRGITTGPMQGAGQGSERRKEGESK